MKKLMEKLRSISVAGRIAFIIMCIEKYLVVKYPEKDWSPIAEEMWRFNDSYWDEWLYSFTDLLPEYIDEYNNFEEYNGKYSYDTFVNLYEDTGIDINELLVLLTEFMEIYLYTCVSHYTESMFPEVIEEVLSYLTKNNIPVPDVEKVSFSEFRQNHGFGDKFDGRYLSIILNR
ncbi:MAG: hypothetical protein NC177_02070 [Ruminococcus flavefaciens]|nr:hypothetical protein [Ruminococcus flavefaciens]